jgi:hypothetical protein
MFRVLFCFVARQPTKEGGLSAACGLAYDKSKPSGSGSAVFKGALKV